MQKKHIIMLACAGVIGMQPFWTPVWATEKVSMTQEQVLAPVVTVEGVTEYRLANGLKVLLYPNPSKPTATVNMTYLVGSRHENYGETGMAHLLEHLMFKGSKNYPNPTKEFTKRGFQMNGTTWLDRTNYFVTFTSNEDNMRWALGWQADSMTNAFIAKKDLDTEMTVVRNEYEMGENSPFSVMMKRMQSMMFDWHSYGRNTIGARSDIENVEIENLQAFYRRYYQPDNAVLTISGRFDEKEVLQWVQEFFGPIPKPTRVLPKEWTVEPTADGARNFEIRRPGGQPLITVGYRVPASLAHDYEAVAMGTQIMSNSPTGRLYKRLVETGMATQVSGFAVAGAHPGFVLFAALVDSEDKVEATRARMIEVIESDFAKKPVTAEELEVEKTEQTTRFDRLLADPDEFAVELTDYIALGDWRLFFADREIVKQTTSEQVDRAAQKYFVRDNRVVGTYLPTTELKRAEIEPAPSAAEILKDFRFKAEGSAVEAFDSTQENLNAATQHHQVGDVKVALLPKPTQGGVVNVAINFKPGVEGLLKNEAVLGIGGSLLYRGTEKMNREEIERRFTALHIQGTPFSFETDRRHLADALRFVGRLMSESTMDQKEFRLLKSQLIASRKAKLDDPKVKAKDALNKVMNNYPLGDPRHLTTSEEAIANLEKLTHEDVLAWYKNDFGMTQGRITIVGDFDADRTFKVLQESVIGKKEKTNAFKRFIARYQPKAAQRITIDTPEKENAVLVAQVPLALSVYETKNVPALMIADYILGGSAGLSNRIMMRLRQQEGLSYGASSNLTLPRRGNNGSWSVFAIVAPQNLAQAEASLRDLLAQAVRDGITQEELDEAKRGFMDYRAVNRSKDYIIAMSWNKLLDDGKDWSFSAAIEKQVMDLTVEEVNAAIRRIAVPEKMTFVLAGDRRKAKAENKDFF